MVNLVGPSQPVCFFLQGGVIFVDFTEVVPGLSARREHRRQAAKRCLLAPRRFLRIRTSGSMLMLVVFFDRTKMEVSIVMGVPPNGWFIRGNPIEMDDLGVPPFQETSI